MRDLPWLSLIVFLPAIGAMVLTRIRSVSTIRATAAACSGASFAMLAAMFALLERSDTEAWRVERYEWVASLGLSYTLAIDGLSVVFAGFAAFLCFVTVTASFRNVKHDDRGFHMAVLGLQSMVLGAILSRDLFLFFLFFQASLLPMFFLIGGWGGEKRVPAATKYAVYSGFGGLALLAGIAAVCVNGRRVLRSLTFDLDELARVGIPDAIEPWIFAAFLVGFATRIPLFPLHSWFPEAQSEAPPSGAVLLSGVMIPLGIYGLVRVMVPLLPEATLDFGPLLVPVLLIGLLYGACLGMAQHDMRKRLAYVSVSQLSLIALGVFALDITSIEGALLMALSHGLVLGAILVLLGILEERLEIRSLFAAEGLGREAPAFAALLGLAAFALIGVPGLSGFVGELLVFRGLFEHHPAWALLAAVGTVFVAVYTLMLVRRVLLGPPDRPGGEPLRDLTNRERVIAGALLAASLAMGIAPGLIQKPIDGPSRTILAPVEEIRFDRLDEEIAERFEERTR